MGFDTREFEFSDTKVQLLGRELTGLRGLKYKKSQEKEPVHGSGNEPKAIQRGKKSYDGTLSVLKSDFDALNAAAVAAGYEDIVDVPGHLIDITCVYQKDGSSALSTDKIINVEFTEWEDGMENADKFKEVSLPFLALKVRKS
jgi:hypothetical protein